MINVDRRALLVGATSFALVYPLRGIAQGLSPRPDVIAVIASAQSRKSLVAVGPFSMNGSVLKVKNCVLSPGSSIIVEDLSTNWVALCFDVLNVMGPSAITRTESIKLDGAPGSAGASGKNWGESGEPGKSGRDGRIQVVPQVFIFIRELQFRGVPASPQDIGGILKIEFDGYPGGRGGDGGTGGDGKDGAKGSHSEDGWPGCYSGPGWGGRGGDAGAGGSAGAPGNGSDAKPIFFFGPISTVTTIENAKVVSTKGGRQGRQGRSGLPGRAGQSGPAGDTSGGCTADASRHGVDGRVPRSCGTEEIDGLSGSDATSEFSSFEDFGSLNI